MKSEGSVDINCGIEDVFRLTNEHVAEWSIVVVEDTVVEDKDGVGTTFHTVTEERGQRMEFDGLVTVWEPPHRCAIQLTGKSFNIEAAYEFEDLGDGKTRVTQHSDVHGKGLTKVMFFLFGWLMKKSSCEAANKEMDSLKAFCENRHAALDQASTEG